VRVWVWARLCALSGLGAAEVLRRPPCWAGRTEGGSAQLCSKLCICVCVCVGFSVYDQLLRQWIAAGCCEAEQGRVNSASFYVMVCHMVCR